MSRAAATLALLAALALPARAGGFYAPEPRAPELPAGVLYPRGRVFPFLGYSGKPERDLKNGFSAAGPVYRGEKAYLERAFAAGWPVVAHLGRELGLRRGGLSPERAAAAVAAEVRALAGREQIQWWALWPEELKPWDEDERRYLAAVSSAARAADPLGRPLYHYNPGHRTAAELAAVAPYLDVLAKGAYANHMGKKRERAWVGRQVADELEALAAAGRPGAFALVMPELSADPEPGEDAEVAAWARHDVYAGLAAGAKGVLIWSLFPRPEVERTWALWYEAYAACGRELAGELGQALLFGEPRSELSVRAPPGLSRRELAYGGSRWLLLVWSERAEAAVMVSGFPAATRAADAFTGAALPAGGGALRLTLPPYGVAALRLSAL